MQALELWQAFMEDYVHDFITNLTVPVRLTVEEHLLDPIAQFVQYADDRITQLLSPGACSRALRKALRYEAQIKIIREASTRFLDQLVLRQLHILDPQQCKNVKQETVAMCEHRIEGRKFYERELKKLKDLYTNNGLMKLSPGRNEDDLLYESLFNGRLQMPQPGKRREYMLDDALIKLTKLRVDSKSLTQKLEDWEQENQKHIAAGCNFLYGDLARDRVSERKGKDFAYRCERCVAWTREKGRAWITRYSPKAAVTTNIK